MGIALRIDHAGAAEALVRETAAVISLPEVCLRLRELLADPAHNRRQVAEVILHDPALSARLMRIVNSAFYGVGSPVRDISQALGIIGEHELNNLVVVTAIVRNLNGLNPGFDLKGFWKSSIFAATLARNLYLYSPGSRREELFLAGLLLDIGKLLLYAKEPGLLRAVRAQIEAHGGPDHEAERQLLGYDHSEVGAALARAWHFSTALQDCIACHHELPANDAGTSMAIVLQVVAWCAGRVDLEQAGIPEDEFMRMAPPPGLMESLGIDASELRYILALSKDGYRQAYEVFCGDHA